MEVFFDSWIIQALKNIIDIVCVAYLFYFSYKLFEDTNSISIIKGFIVIVIIYAVANLAELKTLEWIFKYVVNYFVILVVVLFQPEIRKVLNRLGQSGISAIRGKVSLETLNEITRASFLLAAQKMGGLIIIEHKVGLKQLLEEATDIEAIVKAELLYSIFYKGNILHDGAVLISGEKIRAARVMIPTIKLDAIQKLKIGLGTRHMAGIAATVDSDAVCVIISEEKGSVSIAHNGKLEYELNREEFTRRIHEIFNVE